VSAEARLLIYLGFMKSLKSPPSPFALLKASEGVGGAGGIACRPALLTVIENQNFNPMDCKMLN